MLNLIIAEKPSASEKIAQALADTKPIKKAYKGVPYYEITHKGDNILVACAVGHLYGLSEVTKSGWVYPVFDISWKEVGGIGRSSSFTTKYLQTIKHLAKKADSFTVACDYDLEGEVIGLNVVRYACNKEDASRMKFSTLTKQEILSSYDGRSPHLDWGQAYAGETRHFLDYFWGINLSRALTLSIKHSSGMFKILSSGRVQGPALAFLSEREREIHSFVPVPFWQIEIHGLFRGKKFIALHKEDKFWKKSLADTAYSNARGCDAFVSSLQKKSFSQSPPHPFDLTALQLEAYKTLKINPKDTLAIAQNLYTGALISYPRTSSNQLPPSIGYREIISSLSNQATYRPFCEKILSYLSLSPNNGKKTDPAHPAIYPTGEIPKNLSSKEAKLYDLIVRRTLASFAPLAVRETVTANLDVGGEIFILKGTHTTESGWHSFYGPFALFKEEELPPFKEGDILKISDLTLLDKETQPPKRYTPASIIKELEKRNLGTKATRAQIIDSLYQRNYLRNQSIEVTELGLKTIETLKRFCSDILDEALTRHFEEEMENIRLGVKKPAEVLTEAKGVLLKALSHFKDHEKAIGDDLSEAHRTTRDLEQLVGKCPSCKEGALRIMFTRGKQKRFVACNQYPSCTTTFSLPSVGLIKTSEQLCSECNYPQVLVIRKGKRPWTLCLNHDCPSKVRWREQQAARAAIR
ncbi:DNA topoisomerase I [Candidatus Woesearchaeota archaeon]|nr:DNA topoisomerase I [Candidatus Woesearchaeota archaeon]